MIIKCDNCYKNFDIDSDLIPGNGRLLQCNSCNHKWFFKKEIIIEPVITFANNDSKEKTEPTEEQVKTVKIENPETIELLDKRVKNNLIIEKISIKNKTINDEYKDTGKDIKIKKFQNKKRYNILSLIFIFVISFTALILLLDTFQKPISNILPNIEFLLYNLYETINDIVLFFYDLIL